jgi:ribonuclease HII
MVSVSTTYSYSSYPRSDQLVAGCNEVGRGCLAGPVVVAAVILPPNFAYPLLKDSKQLTVKQRLSADACIKEEALDWAIGLVSAEAMDRMNVLNASHIAMRKAIDRLSLQPSLLLIDGPYFKAYPASKLNVFFVEINRLML